MITFKQEEDHIRGKFIVLEDDKPAGEITYVWASSDKFIIDHTETFEGYSGRGYGKQLVLKAVEFARKKEVKIIPLCPYAKKVITEDSELREMLFK